MKKILAVMAVLFGLTFIAAPAVAHDRDESDGKFVVVTWEMPSWKNDKTATWPQKYVSHVKTDKAGFYEVDAKCGYFQQDIYNYRSDRDRANVDALIAGGVLNGPSNPVHEPLISGGWGKAWRFVNLGECVTPTPTPTETTPTPTPTETTPTPTPTTETPTPTPSDTVTPTPTETSATPTPTESTESPTPTPSETTGTPTVTPSVTPSSPVPTTPSGTVSPPNSDTPTPRVPELADTGSASLIPFTMIAIVLIVTGVAIAARDTRRH